MSSAIIRRFKINGLYGYKDVALEFNDNVLILIAGNGSGKTTILNALHAFLRRRFHRLQSLDFVSIECEFCKIDATVVLKKSSLAPIKGEVHDKISNFAQRGGVSEEELYDFLQGEYKADSRSVQTRSHPVFRALYMSSPMDYPDLYEAMDEMVGGLDSYNTEELMQTSKLIASALGDVEILYLPTYRRIENPLLSPRGKMRRGTSVPARRKALDQSASSDTAHINFGLEDVENRLALLSEEVERTSNLEYRHASATIIDDALADRIRFSSESTAGLPDLEPLKRFLSRVARDRGVSAEGHRVFIYPDQQNERRIASIARLYDTGEIARDDQRLLRKV